MGGVRFFISRYGKGRGEKLQDLFFLGGGGSKCVLASHITYFFFFF